MLIRAGPVLVALPGRPPLPNKALELETLPQGPLLGKPKLRRGAEACFWSEWRCECVSTWFVCACSSGVGADLQDKRTA